MQEEVDIWDDPEAKDARKAFAAALLDIAERRVQEREKRRRGTSSVRKTE